MSFLACNGNVSAAATLAITKPSGLMPGDVLIVYCCSYRSTSAAPTNATIANTGSGGSTWSSVTSRATATYYKSAYAYKTIAANDDGSVTAYTWTATNATQMAGGVIAFRGRKNTAPALANTAYITSDTIIRASTLTLYNRCDQIWAGFNYRSTVQAVTIPSGWTSGTVQTAGAAIACAIAYKENRVAGATGNVDGSMANAVTTKHAFQWYMEEADCAIRQASPLGSRMW